MASQAHTEDDAFDRALTTAYRQGMTRGEFRAVIQQRLARMRAQTRKTQQRVKTVSRELDTARQERLDRCLHWCREMIALYEDDIATAERHGDMVRRAYFIARMESAIMAMLFISNHATHARQ